MHFPRHHVLDLLFAAVGEFIRFGVNCFNFSNFRNVRNIVLIHDGARALSSFAHFILGAFFLSQFSLGNFFDRPFVNFNGDARESFLVVALIVNRFRFHESSLVVDKPIRQVSRIVLKCVPVVRVFDDFFALFSSKHFFANGEDFGSGAIREFVDVCRFIAIRTISAYALTTSFRVSSHASIRYVVVIIIIIIIIVVVVVVVLSSIVIVSSGNNM